MEEPWVFINEVRVHRAIEESLILQNIEEERDVCLEKEKVKISKKVIFNLILST